MKTPRVSESEDDSSKRDFLALTAFVLPSLSILVFFIRFSSGVLVAIIVLPRFFPILLGLRGSAFGNPRNASGEIKFEGVLSPLA